MKLINDASVKIREKGAGIPKLQQLQIYLKAYKITVYAYGNKVMYFSKIIVANLD